MLVEAGDELCRGRGVDQEAGDVLVRAAGLPGTLLAAAIVNLVVGLVAFFIAKLRPPAVAGEAVPPRESAAAFEGDASLIALPMLARLLLIAALGTAIASFVYEVAWIRLLSLVLGSATLLTHDPRFVLAKPAIGHIAIGLIMLTRRWMLRSPFSPIRRSTHVGEQGLSRSRSFDRKPTDLGARDYACM